MRWIIPLATMVLCIMWVNSPAGAQEQKRVWVSSSVQDGTPENTAAFNRLKNYYVGQGVANDRDVSIVALTETAIEQLYSSGVPLAVPAAENVDAFKLHLSDIFADKNNLRVQDGRVTWGEFLRVGMKNHNRGQPGFTPLSAVDITRAVELSTPQPVVQPVSSAEDITSEEDPVAKRQDAEVISVGTGVNDVSVEDDIPPLENEELSGSETVVQSTVSDDRIRGLEARLQALEDDLKIASSRVDTAFQLTGQIESTAEEIHLLKRQVNTESDLVEERFAAIEGSIDGLEETLRAHQTAIGNIRTKTVAIETLATEAKKIAEETASDLVESKTSTALLVKDVDDKTWWESWMLLIGGVVAVLVLMVVVLIKVRSGRNSHNGNGLLVS